MALKSGMAVRFLGTGTTVGMGAGVLAGVGSTDGATVALGVGALTIAAVGAAVGKASTCTVGRIVSVGDCV